MPRLICALPCENAIVSNDNRLSLISLLENLMIGIPAHAQVAPNTVIPMRWFAVCIFERQPGEENTEFETYVQIGNIRSLAARMRFVPTSKFHRVIHQLQGMPLTFGEARMRTYIGPVGQPQVEVGDYPIEFQRGPQQTGPVN